MLSYACVCLYREKMSSNASWWLWGIYCISFNTLRPRRNGHHFADDIFKRIFFNAYIWILIQISLKSVPKDPINNIPALVQIMAWRRPGDKPLSEPMVVIILTHICVTRPQWFKTNVKRMSLLTSFEWHLINTWHLYEYVNKSCRRR